MRAVLTVWADLVHGELEHVEAEGAAGVVAHDRILALQPPQSPALVRVATGAAGQLLKASIDVHPPHRPEERAPRGPSVHGVPPLLRVDGRGASRDVHPGRAAVGVRSAQQRPRGRQPACGHHSGLALRRLLR